MRVRHEIYATIFNGVYVAMLTNVALLVTCAPLVLGLLTTDPARSWPLLAIVTPLCAPGLVAGFAVMSAFSAGRTTGVLRTFGRAWVASWRRATSLGALAVGALVVLGVDIAWAWGRPIGAVAIPVLVMLMLLVVSTAVLCLVTFAQRPTARLRDALRACLYLAVRRWYLTALSLVVLSLLVQVVAARPAMGMGIAAAPLLYVVWANSRFSLRPALDAAPTVGTAPAVAGHPSRRRAAAAGA